MTQAQQWALIVGFLLPLLIAVLQQPGFPKWARATIMAVVCIVGGLVTVTVTGGFHSAHGVIAELLLVALAAIAFYEKWWKQIGATQRIELATTPKKARHKPRKT